MDAGKTDEATVRALERLLEAEPDVKTAYLFGSAAAGGFGPASDVDMAILFDADPPLSRELALHHRVAKALKRDVDLVTLNRIRSLPLLESIIHTGVVIRDRDPEKRFDFELDAHHRYLDFRSMKEYCRERQDG